MKIKLNVPPVLMLNESLTETVLANGTGHANQLNEHFSFKNLIVPLGIITVICLISTLVLGFLMPKKSKILFPWHKRMAIITLISAITHGVMVMIFH